VKNNPTFYCPLWGDTPKHPEKVEPLYQKLFAWEITLKRPLWMIKCKNSQRSIEIFDKFM
jgi:hypothetical protein